MSGGRVSGSRRDLADKKLGVLTNVDIRHATFSVYWDSELRKLCGFMNRWEFEYQNPGESLLSFIVRKLRWAHQAKHSPLSGHAWVDNPTIARDNIKVAVIPRHVSALFRFEIRYQVNTHLEATNPEYWPEWDCRIFSSASSQSIAYGYGKEPASMAEWMKPYITPMELTLLQHFLETA